MLLVVTALPRPLAQMDIAGIKDLAALVGLSPADVRMRLSGVLPRVLLGDGTAAAGDFGGVVRALRAAGVSCLTCDPRAVPGDGQRIVARRVDIAGGQLRVWDGADRIHECPRDDVWLIQRGVRTTVEKRTVTTTQQRLDPGRAILSGGLMLTKKTTQTSTVTNETRESFLLLHRVGGDPDLILYERRMDYRFLGADMQPASRANFDRLLARVRALCPTVTVDERVAQTAFVAGLPPTPADPTDLALHLVAAARRAPALIA